MPSPPAPPMSRRARLKRPRAASDDSGDDWSPSRTRCSTQCRRKKGRFQPPIQKTAAEAESTSVECLLSEAAAAEAAAVAVATAKAAEATAAATKATAEEAAAAASAAAKAAQLAAAAAKVAAEVATVAAAREAETAAAAATAAAEAEAATAAAAVATARYQSVVDKAHQEEEEEIHRRPPSLPMTVLFTSDYLGLALEDQYKARYDVDTKAGLLGDLIVTEFKAICDDEDDTESDTETLTPGLSDPLSDPLETIKQEVVGAATCSWSADDDPLSATPDLTMSVEIKEEDVSAVICSSPDHAPPEREVSKRRRTEVNYMEDEDPDDDYIGSKEEPEVPSTGPRSDGGITLRCVHCDYACLGQNRLDRHVKQRHRNGRYQCERCEYSTDRSHSLKNHRATHTGEQSHRCDGCAKAFTTRHRLTTHRRIHTGQSPYRCDICGKTFIERSNLARHKRIHTGEMVRQCEQCGAKFNQMYHYIRHMKCHNGVKVHRCQVCVARFVQRENLTRHMRIHTGERPYSCSFCPARFTDQSNLKSHITARHKHDFRHRCGRCDKGFTKLHVLQRHVDKCSAAK